MTKSSLIAGAMAIGLILPGLVFAVPSVVNAQSVGSGQTGGSVAFVREAGHTGLFEMQAGQLALQRSQHIGVRGYAGQTVKDASAMLNRVKFINESNVGASMPSTLSDIEQNEYNRLASLNGPDFDREYMRSQIAASDFLAKTFTAYGANGESSTMRVYAAKSASDYEKQGTLARTVMGSL
jgi:putative membrane protein